MKDRITVFSIDITIKIPLRFFAFRLCRCSTVKSRSKREKLSLKTLIIPRVRLAIEFGSFFIYATILSFFVDFGDCDFNSYLRLLFSVLLRLCRKANKKNGGISKMKKVVYSIRKVRGNSDYKISGLGFLNDEGTLFCKCTSQDGKRYLT